MNIATGRLALIEDRIGYEFENKDLFNLAFTHRSANPKTNNEILEFDGDKVLNFVIGTFLSRNYQLNEGKLTKLTSYFVNNKHVLPSLCLELGLDEFLYITDYERNNELSRRKWIPSLLEALIGAVYQDSEDDVEITKDLIYRLYGERLELDNEKIEKILRKCDPISSLTEYCQNLHFFEVYAKRVGGSDNAPKHRGYVEMGARDYEGDVILGAQSLAKENVCEKVLADLKLI
ncbi:MAG: hypothetical protein K8R13_11545 [Methanococcoides sp.]|nr:hypothetical protein [Methanococcoides sp.]